MTRPGAGDAYATALLKSMVEIPSPSYAEAELAHHLLGAMRELGYAAYLDDVGNAIGELDCGPGPTIMLLGHLDTVAGNRPVYVHHGRLYGRGAVDAKGPLAALICAPAIATGFRGRVVVVAAVEEETPRSRGAARIRDSQPKPDALVIGEPSGWRGVVVGYRGKLDLTYRVECAPTHPSNPRPKASELAAQLWTDVLALLGPHATHAAFDRPAATLVSMVGDLTTASAEISIRTPPGFDAEALVAAARARCECGVIEVVQSVAACRVRQTDPVVRSLRRAIVDQGGVPKTKLRTGTSDMNTLAQAWSVPMATYGPGDNRLDHSDDEHIDLDEFGRAVTVLANALPDLAGRLGPVPTEGR